MKDHLVESQTLMIVFGRDFYLGIRKDVFGIQCFRLTIICLLEGAFEADDEGRLEYVEIVTLEIVLVLVEDLLFMTKVR